MYFEVEFLNEAFVFLYCQTKYEKKTEVVLLDEVRDFFEV
jgi:hypothetical protein